MSINDLAGFINLNLELSGVRQAPEYKQIKGFIKMLTSLDIENEILESLLKIQFLRLLMQDIICNIFSLCPLIRKLTSLSQL